MKMSNRVSGFGPNVTEENGTNYRTVTNEGKHVVVTAQRPTDVEVSHAGHKVVITRRFRLNNKETHTVSLPLNLKMVRQIIVALVALLGKKFDNLLPGDMVTISQEKLNRLVEDARAYREGA
jgi:hypothetical protein